MSSGEWIDISVPIRDAMVRWPGDPPVQVQRIHAIEHGDAGLDHSGLFVELARRNGMD